MWFLDPLCYFSTCSACFFHIWFCYTVNFFSHVFSTQFIYFHVIVFIWLIYFHMWYVHDYFDVIDFTWFIYCRDVFPHMINLFSCYIFTCGIYIYIYVVLFIIYCSHNVTWVHCAISGHNIMECTFTHYYSHNNVWFFHKELRKQSFAGW